MEKPQKKTEKYTSELEEKIIELSLKLKANSKLLELTNNKNDTLISTLTHNLKNPIGIAYSFSEMMLENSNNYTSEKIEKHLQIIKESSQYAINLLNSFVIFQQINSPKCVYNFELNNYIELLDNVVNDVTKTTQKQPIIVLNNTLKEPILLNIDAEKIALALKQIIQNAIRFSKENSKITITVKSNNNTVETTITDKGIGISENDLANVFKDFFVVNTYDAYKQKCIGLGLPIARNILKNHHGDIAIKSIYGQGSSVKITLPINK